MTAPLTPPAFPGAIIEVNGTRVELPRDLRGCGANAVTSVPGISIRIGSCRVEVANRLAKAICERMGQPAMTPDAAIEQAIQEVRSTMGTTDEHRSSKAAQRLFMASGKLMESDQVVMDCMADTRLAEALNRII